MNKNLDLVILAFPSWESDYGRSTVFLAEKFPNHKYVNKTLYVDYPYTIKDLFFNKFASFKKMLGFSKRLRQDKNLWVLTLPPILPMNWAKNWHVYQLLLRINSNIIKRSILKTFKKLEIKDPVVISAFNPIFGSYLINDFDSILDVYYCYDEISACDWAKEHGTFYEAVHAQEVDLVLTTSPALKEKFVKLNSNTELVPNGVDYAIYDKHFHPRKFEKETKATIGYLGSIDNRLDYELLEYMVQNIPEANFKFMGRITDDTAHGLKKYNNVEFTGALTPEELAFQTSQLSLGLIPFVKNEFTRNVYPLKINEYFAVGLPVVSTNFADLSDFDGEIKLANDKKIFTNEVKKEIIRNNPMKAIRRNNIAHKNSWESRANLFIDHIKNRLDAQ